VGCNNLLEQLNEVREHPKDYKMLGDFGEAVAEVLLHHVFGHDVVVDAATRGGSQGVDLITYDAAKGKLALSEVKSTQKAEYRMPSMNSRTKQMSDYWSSDRSQKAGMDAVEETDFTDGEIDKIVVQVDVERDIVSIWGVDGAGKRDDNAPEMTLALEDLVRFVDAINADEV
jgi:hypothetical protein